MNHRKIWNAVSLAVCTVLLVCSVHLIRLDAVLRRTCKDALYENFFGQTGLILLMLLVAAFLCWTLWQWIAERPAPGRRRLAVLLAACVVFAVLAHGYTAYHHTVYIHTAHQEKYDKRYDKGLLYDLKGLFK